MSEYTRDQIYADMTELQRRRDRAPEAYHEMLDRWLGELRSEQSKDAPLTRKTIELSDSESRKWSVGGDLGHVFRQGVLDREQRWADRLGVTVELFHRDGRKLAVLHPTGASAKRHS